MNQKEKDVKVLTEKDYDDIGAPEELIIKSKEDLIEKLKAGIESSKNERHYTFDEVVESIKKEFNFK
jgi:hypothetical protein